MDNWSVQQSGQRGQQSGEGRPERPAPPKGDPSPPATQPPAPRAPHPGSGEADGGERHGTGPGGVSPGQGTAGATPAGVESVVPPQPSLPPQAGPPLPEWLRDSRPEAEPGVWRHGHQPPPPEDPERIPARQLVSGAIVSFLIAWLVWSLLSNKYLGNYWLWPLLAMTPESWRAANSDQKLLFVIAQYVYMGIVIALLIGLFGRMGRWDELARRVWGRLRRLYAKVQERRAVPPPPPAPQVDPVRWPQLRALGCAEAAERLTAETESGALNDVDHARILRAWQTARANPQSRTEFQETVRQHGAAAFAHPSGDRDLPTRAARHDLALRQVRIGTAAQDEHNQHGYRGAGIALEPSLLGTSALVVGPPGSGKTSRLVRPAVESLCLQALTRQAAVVVVTASGSRVAPDELFDIVLPIGGKSGRDIDLYGGTTDPDEAAGMLAEALVGDLTARLPGGDSRRAATCVAQLIGPFQVVHGRFPTVPELRELFSGPPTELRNALARSGQTAQLRDLEAYERQLSGGETATLLADRIALLDRPAFADFFVPEGAREEDAGRPPFSLRALEYPVRVRVDLPERSHAEASHVLARLLLAQFTECATARGDQALFNCLVMDAPESAAQTVTPQSLRQLQRLRSANAGVLLALRGLDEIPEQLRGSLLGAVGCRAVCAGVTPWDAERFAEVWGTEWVQQRDVTNRQLVSDEPLTRVMHAVRRLATGKYATAESITVRTVQRERWSASELSNELQAGHVVLSVTTVAGERSAPILAKLGE